MLRVALSILICVSLASCSSIKIYDDPWCADAGAFGAECFNTLSQKEFSLNKYEWDKRRVGQICSATLKPGEAYYHIKVALEKSCADNGFCTPEQAAALDAVSQKIEAAQREADGANPFLGSTPADSAAMEERGEKSLELQLGE